MSNPILDYVQNSIILSQRIHPDMNSAQSSKMSTMESQGAMDFSSLQELPQSAVNAGNNSTLYKRLQHPADKSLLLSFLTSIAFLLAAVILMIPAVSLVLMLLPIGWCVRQLLAHCCCCFKPCITMLSSRDVFWLHNLPSNKAVVQCIFTLEEGIDLCRVRDLVQARLISAQSKDGCKLYPRFSQRVIPLCMGYAWKDDNEFTISNHVYSMPDTIVSKQDLEEYVSSLAAQDLIKNRPLWEMQILTNFGMQKDTVILLRIHPCLSDGISLLHILFISLADKDSVFTLKPRFGRGAFLFNVIRAIVIGPLVFLWEWVITRTDQNSLHGVNLSGNKICSWSEPFSLASAVRIKKVTRSSLNDVLLAVVAGSLRTCLQLKGSAHPVDITATIPIDLRKNNADLVAMGNQLALLNMHLPTNTEGAIPRLWDIKQRMDEIKNSAYPVILYCSHWLLYNCLPIALYHHIWERILDKATVLVSNLPGPENSVSFASREVKSMIYMFPARGRKVGISIAFFTYADQIQMSVCADKAVLPNPHVITKDFIFQMNRYTLLLANRRTPGEHGSRHHHHQHQQQQQNRAQDSPSMSTMEELHQKMAFVQQQLQELKVRLDVEASRDQYSAEERSLVDKVEQLKEEFRDLLTELRRKKAHDGRISDEEDEEDGKIRRGSYHRQSSFSSHSSQVFSTSPPRSSVCIPSAPSLQSPTSDDSDDEHSIEV